MPAHLVGHPRRGKRKALEIYTHRHTKKKKTLAGDAFGFYRGRAYSPGGWIRNLQGKGKICGVFTKVVLLRGDALTLRKMRLGI